MYLQFMTVRSNYGHRYYLAFDTERKVYATECANWLHKEIPVIKSKDIKAIRETIERDGYTRIENL